MEEDEDFEPAPHELLPVRLCATEGCSTKLSRYNSTEYCSTCTNPRKVDRRLLSPVRIGDALVLEET